MNSLKNKVNSFRSKFHFIRILFHVCVFNFLLNQTYNGSAQDKIKYDSLIAAYNTNQLPDDTNKVKLLYSLSTLASENGIQGDAQYKTYEPNHFYQEGLNLSVKLKYIAGIHQFYKTLGLTFNQNTEIPILGLDTYDDIISNKNFKDFYYYRNKKHNGSLNNYYNALSSVELLGINESAYLIEFWIGLIYFDWFNYSKALLHFNNALGYQNVYKDTINLSDIYQFIGITYFFKKNYDSSTLYIAKALCLNELKEYEYRTAVCNSNLGYIYKRSSNFQLSKNYYKRASLSSSKLNDSLLYAHTLNEIGEISIYLEQYDDSKVNLIKSMSIAGKLNEKKILKRVYGNLSILSKCQGDYKNAYCYQTKQHQIYDTLLIDEVASYFSNYESNWQNAIGREITKKESEALKMSQTSFALNKSRFFIALMGIIMISILLISTYTFRLYRLKQKTNDYLTELNKSKEKLLSIISHDVRGPIIGFIDLLEPLSQQIRNLTAEQISEYLHQVIELSQSIKLLVDNLLEWSKTQRGLISCQPETFTLHEVIRDNIAIYSQIANSKSISIINKVQSNLAVVTDRNMLQVIVRNLLNNALKFTDSGGFVTIDARLQNKLILVSVSDTGIGINNDVKNTIFSNENKLNEFGLKRKNLGLGLLLCKEYVEKCGGNIWVESLGEGKGSSFYFTLKTVEIYG